MTFGGYAYGSAGYGSSAPVEAATDSVALAPAVVDLAAPSIPPVYQQALAPARVDLAAPAVTPAVYDDAYHKVVLQDGPLIYWRLGESAGSTAADDSGNGFDGTYQNSPTLGVSGALAVGSDTAVTFAEGSDQYVTVADDAAFDSNDYSVEIWFKTSTDGTFVLRANSWYIQTDASGNLYYVSQGDATLYTSGTDYNDGAWHHVVGVHDYSGSLATLYVDGASVATDSSLNTVSAATAITVASDNAGGGMSGTLDEFAYYTSALTAAQVLEHYETGTASEPVPLAPAVVELAAPAVAAGGSNVVPLAPAVVELAAPGLTIPQIALLAPAVVELAAPRFTRRMLLTPWTLDDWGSTAFGMEVQQEPDLRWGDPVAEAGWRPIKTNRVEWGYVTADPDTGRPTTPTTASIDLEPAVLELVGKPYQI